MKKNKDNVPQTTLPTSVDSSDIDFYESIAALIKQARRSLERATNTVMTVTYFEIGRRIVEKEQQGEKRAKYGERILQGLSKHLTAQLGRGYSVDNLELMRKFYNMYADNISESLIRKFNPAISWTHYIQLMRIVDENERRFYEIEIAENNWTIREFQRQFNSSLYERLALSRGKEKVLELAQKGQVVDEPQDLLKEPLVLEFTGLPERSDYTETDLEQKIINHLQQFILELGKGFAFIGRQVRFTFEEESFWVDLVFYNRLLRCFVLIDLKIGKLKHQDIGQMLTYVNYYDRRVKLDDENPTIGIVLCKDKKASLVEMMLPENNSQIFASRYQTVLPSKKELKKLLDES